MNIMQAIKVCQQRRDYSEHPDYWEPRDDYEDDGEEVEGHENKFSMYCDGTNIKQLFVPVVFP